MSKNLGSGAIAGIVVGSVAGAAIFVVGAITWFNSGNAIHADSQNLGGQTVEQTQFQIDDIFGAFDNSVLPYLTFRPISPSVQDASSLREDLESRLMELKQVYIKNEDISDLKEAAQAYYIFIKDGQHSTFQDPIASFYQLVPYVVDRLNETGSTYDMNDVYSNVDEFIPQFLSIYCGDGGEGCAN